MPAQTIAFVLFPVALLCAALLAYRCWKRQWKLSLILLLLPIACEGVAVKSAVCIARDWDGVETGPSSFGQKQFIQEDIVGVWRSNDRKMVFMADGTFIDWNGATSRWTKTPSELQAGETTWVVWKKHGQLVLLPRRQVDPDNDPDEWNLHGMFYRESLGTPAAGSASIGAHDAGHAHP